MTINSINGANTQMGQTGMNQAADSYSRNIQNQIANAQKQLQELSSNENMTLEEKMKKRQEIQQQISELNMQLRQHQMEQRRAAMEGSGNQRAKGSSMDDLLGGTRNAGTAKAGSKSAGLSQASMTAIMSVDGAIKQAKIQGGVATKMEGRAGVLQAEIKLDRAGGGDTRKKEEELAQVEQKAQAATASQLSTLAEASRTMEEAARADSREEKTDKDAKTDKDMKATDAKTDKDTKATDAEGKASEDTSQQPTPRGSVDIRL